MIRTFLLLAVLTAVMAGLNLTGAANIPWIVVVIPILAPFAAWLAASILAIGVIGVAWLVERIQNLAAKK